MVEAPNGTNAIPNKTDERIRPLAVGLGRYERDKVRREGAPGTTKGAWMDACGKDMFRAG